ncbi:hypothetical protein ACQEVF_47390 [Nonomuraea polychroma]|uniref:hypothetical protein n=1 Tax=Nonomuraea polychroma TaxID=46176 RepID=UPI003D90BAD6
MQNDEEPGGDGEEINAALNRLVNSDLFRESMRPLQERLAEVINPVAAEISRSVKSQMTALTEEFNRRAEENMALLAKAVASSIRHEQILESLAPALTNLWETIAPALKQVGDLISDQLPTNWRDVKLDLDKVEEILLSDGIALAWVPRAEIVSMLMACASREDRIQLLMERRAELRIDCRQCLDSVDDPGLSEWVDLARKSISAWEDGHDEAAQTLATITIESVASRHIAKPARAVEMASSVDWETLTLRRLKMAVALGPLIRFYEKWFPDEGKPPLTTLSRHTTVHHPSTAQVNPENCMLAIMLLSSTLRAIQEVTLDMRRKT